MCCGVYGKRLRRERYLFLSFVRVLRCVALRLSLLPLSWFDGRQNERETKTRTRTTATTRKPNKSSLAVLLPRTAYLQKIVMAVV